MNKTLRWALGLSCLAWIGSGGCCCLVFPLPPWTDDPPRQAAPRDVGAASVDAPDPR